MTLAANLLEMCVKELRRDYKTLFRALGKFLASEFRSGIYSSLSREGRTTAHLCVAVTRQRLHKHNASVAGRGALHAAQNGRVYAEIAVYGWTTSQPQNERDAAVPRPLRARQDRRSNAALRHNAPTPETAP